MKNHFGFRLAFPQHAIVCPGNLAVKYHLCQNVNWITLLKYRRKKTISSSVAYLPVVFYSKIKLLRIKKIEAHILNPKYVRK